MVVGASSMEAPRATFASHGRDAALNGAPSPRWFVNAEFKRGKSHSIQRSQELGWSPPEKSDLAQHLLSS